MRKYRFRRLGKGGLVTCALGYEKEEKELTTEELEVIATDIMHSINEAPDKVRLAIIKKIQNINVKQVVKLNPIQEEGREIL